MSNFLPASCIDLKMRNHVVWCSVSKYFSCPSSLSPGLSYFSGYPHPFSKSYLFSLVFLEGMCVKCSLLYQYCACPPTPPHTHTHKIVLIFLYNMTILLSTDALVLAYDCKQHSFSPYPSWTVVDFALSVLVSYFTFSLSLLNLQISTDVKRFLRSVLSNTI